MEGRPVARRESRQRGERALEVGEIRPRVAVVGPEAREVDVAEIELALALETEERVATRVSGRVERADAHAAAELEHVAVAEGQGVGPRLVVEVFDDDPAERRVHRLRVSGAR